MKVWGCGAVLQPDTWSAFNCLSPFPECTTTDLSVVVSRALTLSRHILCMRTLPTCICPHLYLELL